MNTVAIKILHGVFMVCTPLCPSFSTIAVTAYLFVSQRAQLIWLYGKNKQSNSNQTMAAQELVGGKEFKEIAQILHEAEATVKV